MTAAHHTQSRASEYKHLYNYRWQKLRKAFLTLHPLCECDHCKAGELRVLVANVVDHKVPHKGNIELFWDQANWQAMNKVCHDRHKALLERTGRVAGADAEGTPLDPRHHWRAKPRPGG
jgi:5-methylcytosine-specific restriction protein A